MNTMVQALRVMDSLLSTPNYWSLDPQVDILPSSFVTFLSFFFPEDSRIIPGSTGPKVIKIVPSLPLGRRIKLLI